MDGILPKEIPWNTERLIIYYHKLKPKLKYKHICMVINQYHRKPLTMRGLKEIIRKNGLSRRKNITNDEATEAITLELQTSMSSVGYRQMTEFVSVKYEINISKEDVRLILKELDPDGVEERRNRVIKRRRYESNGPWGVFHMDGNDKLKRFGFAIHGCIDGFSRKLMWLSVSTTNNDPLVIANYYLICIKKYKQVPQLLRMDGGTENIYCRDMQFFFTNSEDSFLNAASTRNQRIEAYWSRLKKFKLSWWIEFFSDMVSHHIYKPSNEFHQEALLFAFLPVIQLELNESLKVWNARNIRQSSSAPGGVPNILFHISESIGYRNQGFQTLPEEIEVVEDLVEIQQPPISKEKDIFDLITCYVHIHNLSVSRDAESALDLFATILNLFNRDGFEV